MSSPSDCGAVIPHCLRIVYQCTRTHAPHTSGRSSRSMEVRGRGAGGSFTA